MKIRTRLTAEAVVGGVLGSLDHPEALVLGRHDERGRFRVAGRTTLLPRAVRSEVGAVLQPAGAFHPWPATLPPPRFGAAGPVAYTTVKPSVVVELVVDAAVDVIRGRPVWRHPVRFERIRAELRPTDLDPARLCRTMASGGPNLPDPIVWPVVGRGALPGQGLGLLV